MVPLSSALRIARFALTCTVVGVSACEGDTESQFTPLSVLVVTEIGTGSPLLVTWRDDGSGLDPGELAKNSSCDWSTLMIGSALAWNVTLTVVGSSTAFGPM